MADAAWTATAPAREAEVGDFFELMKPRVMWLALFTALVGMLSAPAPVHPVLAIAALVCIGAGAGAAGALNMWWDRDIDAVMARTAGRPLPSGRVERDAALAFGLILAGFSVTLLGLVANLVAAGMLVFTIFFYVVVYSVWLKRSTPQNIVIGGAAGAFPPVIGWAAATGGVSVESLMMFAVIFLWTPPHFWALALFRNDDYARAGVPMLPVTAGPRATRTAILAYAAALAAAALAPAFSAIGGPVYVAGALALNVRLLAAAWSLARRDEAAARADGMRVEKRFFGLSIAYLFLVFGLMLASAGLAAAGLVPDWWPAPF
jgi:protoheme IX farnesyltransferase